MTPVVTSPPGPGMATSPYTGKSPALPIKRGQSRSLPPRSNGPSPSSSLQENTTEDLARRIQHSLSRSRANSNMPGSVLDASSFSVAVPAAEVTVTGFDLGMFSSGCPPSDSKIQPRAFTLPKARPQQGLLSMGLGQQLGDATSSKNDTTSSIDRSPRMSPIRFLPGTCIPYTNEPLELLQAAQAKHAVFKTELVQSAYLVAARAHAGQTRKSGDPVLLHCVETACILADLGLSEELVAGGLLHDVLSDTSLTRYALAEHVPAAVVELVERVTKISSASQMYRDNAHSVQAERILAMLSGFDDVGALLVKLADRLHNMRTISSLPRCKQVRMAEETLAVFAVLANRLGTWSLKAELEDLCFATLQPEDYAALEAQVTSRRRAQRAQLDGHLAALKSRLDDVGLHVEDMSGRCKNLYGMWRKMQKSGCSLEQVYDATALRVVVENRHDCYRVLREVHGLWGAVAGRYKDYIRDHKPNGYQSLHETVLDADGVPFEVQIRTVKMHYIAEYGMAAHWRYKEQLSDEAAWEAKLRAMVQYKKYLTAVQYGVHDKKARPLGTPPRDMSLAALLAHVEQPADADDSATDPFLRNERFRLRPVTAEAARLPVSIIVQTGRGAAAVRDVPAGSTINRLLVSGVLGRSPDRARVMVNGVEVFDGSRLLCIGDQVELLPAESGVGGATLRRGNSILGGGGGSSSRPRRASADTAAAAMNMSGLDIYLPGADTPVSVPMGLNGMGEMRAALQPAIAAT